MCCALFDVCRLSSVVVYFCMMFEVFFVLFCARRCFWVVVIVRWSLRGACCSLLVVCCLLFEVCCKLCLGD